MLSRLRDGSGRPNLRVKLLALLLALLLGGPLTVLAVEVLGAALEALY